MSTGKPSATVMQTARQSKTNMYVYLKQWYSNTQSMKVIRPAGRSAPWSTSQHDEQMMFSTLSTWTNQLLRWNELRSEFYCTERSYCQWQTLVPNLVEIWPAVRCAPWSDRMKERYFHRWVRSPSYRT
jgi:hypothetical protein